MLGIIVGVAAVIALIAIGSGAQTKIADQIRSLGSNVLLIEPVANLNSVARSTGNSRFTLTEADTRAVAQLSGVRAAAPSVRGSAQIVNGNRNWSTVVNGTTADYFVVRDWPLVAGRHFSSGEESRAGRSLSSVILLPANCLPT